ncbi:MAG: hypothetical protein ACJASQ_003879 [Crocinitomicaceae bacterium]
MLLKIEGYYSCAWMLTLLTRKLFNRIMVVPTILIVPKLISEDSVIGEIPKEDYFSTLVDSWISLVL